VWASPLIGRCGVPEDHALFAGHLPAFRDEIAKRLAGHDVLVALGAPVFTYHAESQGPYVPDGLQVFQVTEDPDLAAAAIAGHSVLANVGATVAELLLTKRVGAPSAQSGRVRAPALGPATPIPPAFLMQTLAQLRPADSIVVEEAPSTRGDMQAYLPINRAESFYTCASGGLGHGLPASVGIALAKPGRKVIALLGDGSAMYSIQGLWTAAKLRLPICFVIVNNSRYEALRHFAQRFELEQAVGTELGGLDFAAIAVAQGCTGLRVESAEDLPRVLKQALQSDGPVLVDVRVA
jgi:benzoylformate decarboxylase